MCNEMNIQECRHEIKRLSSIVDKLPKTADGVPVIPRIDKVFWRFDGGKRERVVDSKWRVLPIGGGASEPLVECYSTREAAQEAMKK